MAKFGIALGSGPRGLGFKFDTPTKKEEGAFAPSSFFVSVPGFERLNATRTSVAADGERCDRCLRQIKGAVRVAAVGVQRRHILPRRTPGTATGMTEANHNFSFWQKEKCKQIPTLRPNTMNRAIRESPLHVIPRPVRRLVVGIRFPAVLTPRRLWRQRYGLPRRFAPRNDVEFRYVSLHFQYQPQSRFNCGISHSFPISEKMAFPAEGLGLVGIADKDRSHGVTEAISVRACKTGD